MMYLGPNRAERRARTNKLKVDFAAGLHVVDLDRLACTLIDRLGMRLRVAEASPPGV